MTRVIFLHVPKTAGSAFKRALARQYDFDEILPVPDDFRPSEAEYPILADAASMGYQMTLSDADVAGYRLIMGHYDWRLVARLSTDWRVVVMLRHPVRQLISLYNFYRGDRNADLEGSHELCNRLSFRQWLDTEHCHMRLNQVCQVLSGKRHGVWVDYEGAEVNLGRCVVGIVEELERSVECFNQAFGWELPTELERVNASMVQAEDVVLDEETWALALHNQRYDMMLYSRVLEEQFGHV